MVGTQFNRLTVIGLAESRDGKHQFVRCKCVCENEIVTRLYWLKRGLTGSCGCLKIELLKSRSLKHGHKTNYKASPEYSSWRHMKDRCLNAKSDNYKNYGGRGIKVCLTWANSFTRFLLDMGKRPSIKHTLDRINVNGDYEPGNCRWATGKQQARNKRRHVLLEAA